LGLAASTWPLRKLPEQGGPRTMARGGPGSTSPARRCAKLVEGEGKGRPGSGPGGPVGPSNWPGHRTAPALGPDGPAPPPRRALYAGGRRRHGARPVTDAEKQTRRAKVKAKRRRRGAGRCPGRCRGPSPGGPMGRSRSSRSCCCTTTRPKTPAWWSVTRGGLRASRAVCCGANAGPGAARLGGRQGGGGGRGGVDPQPTRSARNLAVGRRGGWTSTTSREETCIRPGGLVYGEEDPQGRDGRPGKRVWRRGCCTGPSHEGYVGGAGRACKEWKRGGFAPGGAGRSRRRKQFAELRDGPAGDDPVPGVPWRWAGRIGSGPTESMCKATDAADQGAGQSAGTATNAEAIIGAGRRLEQRRRLAGVLG